ncbi:MAG TPA: SIS domain-containing protein [Stellaceae bacterium]
MIDAAKFFDAELAEHRALVERMTGLRESFAQALSVWTEAIKSGGKLLFFGNGGSASDAQHLATELTVRYARDRAAIAAISLTADGTTLTAAGNDLGFALVFSRQIEALGRKGDVAVAISTSGKSENVLHGLSVARERGLKTVGLLGGDGGKAKSLCDVALVVPSNVTARVQEMHIMLGQMLCAALERGLGLAP